MTTAPLQHLTLPDKVEDHYDVYGDTTSLHGYRADELVSALQKSIRRGLVENAVLVGHEMSVSSPELEAKLWSRLTVISVEDIGFGNPVAPVVIRSLYEMHLLHPYGIFDRRLFAIHAIRFLATQPKERTSDELANWAGLIIDNGGGPEILDVMRDLHTKAGRALSRGRRHFYEEASWVANEIPDRDTTYRKALLAALDAADEPTTHP